MEKDYSIGLDLGTGSVGWAVTDSEGQLLRYKGKFMLGSSLFEGAETAVVRRDFRSARRRKERKKVRIGMLQDLLLEDMMKYDENFYKKLKESKFHTEDRKYENFYDELFGKERKKIWGKEIENEKFKSIYHLRNSILASSEKEDFRLVYLAIHHIVKYRGNFLYEGQKFNAEEGMRTSIENLLISLKNDENHDIDISNIEKIEKILKDKKTDKKEKKKKLELIFKGIKSEKIKEESYKYIGAVLIGSKCDYKKIFSIEAEKIEFKLSEEKAETELDGLLTDDEQEIFECFKNIYSAFILGEILGENEYISKAMVTKYNDHKKDLEILKKIIKEHFKNEYDNIFRSNENGLCKYELYLTQTKKYSQEDFSKDIKKIIEKKKETLSINDDYKYCIDKIENENFLLKLNTVDNGKIPYQLHEAELEKILKEQGKYYPSLKENLEKIILLFKFRIPYYVGPLSRKTGEEKSKWSWLKTKNDEKIYPWNFESVVDIDKSAEEFILRMRNKCTYLQQEDTIPKNSLLYSEFMLLNELNKISVGEKRLSTVTKKQLIEELFKKEKTITKTKLQKKLKEIKCFYQEDVEITGFQKENSFASSLSSYNDFQKITGKINEETSQQYENIEEIIKWITLFEDKKILIRKIEQQNSLNLDTEVIKKVANLKYKGWSRLSLKLLVELKATGGEYERRSMKELSIIEIMRETNLNFMQIIENNQFGFNELISNENRKKDSNQIKYDDVKELAGSPGIKKGIWHTIKVVKEIEKIMGNKPSNLYFEMAREEGVKGKRTSSRYKALDMLYGKIEKDVREFTETKEELKRYEKEPKKLDSKSLYLYFIQNGKCLYSGKDLDIDKLSQECEIDHIVPQSFIKDDSFNNLALVIKKENQNKGDSLNVCGKIKSLGKVNIEKLYKNGLISVGKYNKLTRKDEFTDRELGGFISRQIVETRQIIKNVIQLLQVEYPETEMSTLKANLVSDLRGRYELYKNREINDYHHAHDAYFLCMIGSFIKKCYPKLGNSEFNYDKYVRIFKKEATEQAKKATKYSWLISKIGTEVSDEDGVLVWCGSEKIKKMKEVMTLLQIFISKKTEEQTGEFYDQTLYSPKSATKGLIPQNKNLNSGKYGGYKSENKAYYVVIEYLKKVKKTRELIAIPIMISKKGNLGVEKYLKELKGLEVNIVSGKILKYQKIKYEGNEWYMASDSEMHNAFQLSLPSEYQKVIWKFNKKIKKEEEIFITEKCIEIFDYVIKEITEKYSCYKNIAPKLMKGKEKFIKLPLVDFEKGIDKISFIRQMLGVTKAGAGNGRFKKFDIALSDTVGRINGKVLNPEKIEFIYSSITGMLEKRTTIKGLEKE